MILMVIDGDINTSNVALSTTLHNVCTWNSIIGLRQDYVSYECISAVLYIFSKIFNSKTYHANNRMI